MDSGDKPLFRFFFYLISVLLLASVVATAIYIIIPVAEEDTPSDSAETKDDTTDTSDEKTVISDALLTETADAGIAYQDQIMFIGESTTAHLVNREVLSDGNETTQVIKPPGNTITLYRVPDIESFQWIAPSTGASETLRAIIAEEKPAYLIMNFGINGLNYNVGMYGDSPKATFISQYQTMIDIVREASPETVLILQAVYPVADSPDCESRFACSTTEANKRIDSLNQSILALAEENDIYYLNSAEVLKDKDGNLKAEYAEAIETDCIHLTKACYKTVLSYIRTHSAQ